MATRNKFLKLCPEVITELVRLTEEGATRREMCKHVGVNVKTVGRFP